MLRPIRRVVTIRDAEGKAVVGIDGPAGNVRVRQASGGLVSTLLWVTDETPADIYGRADRADREIGVAPPARGSAFRIVDFPTTADSASLDSAAVIREMGISRGGTNAGGENSGDKTRHPLMHRTRSIDYAIVISGEIDMLLDDTEVHLRAGDVVVQQGTNHAWVNRGRENCRIAFVLIDAEELAPPGNVEKLFTK
jgi:mannose-6-phosphate isomerase-like protein (cupin superfamily)